jgi:hypothetical protein
LVVVVVVVAAMRAVFISSASHSVGGERISEDARQPQNNLKAPIGAAQL